MQYVNVFYKLTSVTDKTHKQPLGTPHEHSTVGYITHQCHATARLRVICRQLLEEVILDIAQYVCDAVISVTDVMSLDETKTRARLSAHSQGSPNSHSSEENVQEALAADT